MILAVKVFFVILVVVTLLAFNKKIGGVILKAAFQRLMKQEHRDKTDELFEDFHKGMEAFYKPSPCADFAFAPFLCFLLLGLLRYRLSHEPSGQHSLPFLLRFRREYSVAPDFFRHGDPRGRADLPFRPDLHQQGPGHGLFASASFDRSYPFQFDWSFLLYVKAH